MRKNNLLSKDVDLDKLAIDTKNYTGAEIEAVCRSATSFALFDEIGLNPNGASSVASEIKVDKKNKNKFEEKIIHHADFERALSEIKPSFVTVSHTVSIYLKLPPSASSSFFLFEKFQIH